jgi:4-amino-4-deoxy-L-arabinose transferase-like glycosyltransferase
VKSSWLKSIFGLFLAAVVFRIGFFIYCVLRVPFSSDESWPALMAYSMLKGEFPIMYWGQSYMGTQESVFQALLIPVFGFNVPTMRFYTLLFAFVYLAVTYVLAKRTCGQTTALITLAILVVPVPYLTLCGSIGAPDNYLAMTALGSLSLLLLHGLVFGPPEHRLRSYLLLGFVLGYTFYLHILVVSYIAVVALFIFLKDKLFLLRKEFWAGVLAFFVGSLPFWWYDWTHRFSTFRDVAGTVGWDQALGKLYTLFAYTLHLLVGMKLVPTGDNWNYVSLPRVLAWPLGALWLGVVLLAVVFNGRKLLPLLKLSVKGSDGTAILVASAAASIFVCVRSYRFSWLNVRYILPILSVLPILFACGLARIRAGSRSAFAVILIFVLGAQAWGNVTLVKLLDDPRVITEDINLPDTRNLLRFLDQHGIHHAYAHFWLSYRLTFESGTKLLCSEPYNQRFPGREVKFLDQVNASTNAAYIWVDQKRMDYVFGRDFEQMLKAIGGSYRKDRVDLFTVYHDFAPPYGDIPLREIKRDGWTAGSERIPSDARYALDGDMTTRWHTGKAQTGGLWFQVDMGRIERICKLRFDQGQWVKDSPGIPYQVETSVNGRDWTAVLKAPGANGDLFWEGAHPRFCVYGDFFTAAFVPVDARFVRITLTDEERIRPEWSIAEMRAYGPET